MKNLKINNGDLVKIPSQEGWLGIVKPIDDGIGIVITSKNVKKYSCDDIPEDLSMYKVLSNNKIINFYEGQITHLTASNR